MRLLKLLVLFVLLMPATAAAKTAPGAPGERALWTAADKDGFGTSHSTKSKVWHTLNDGELTEVYYPRLDTPAFRDLQFVVSDGKTFAERETYVADPARNALLVDVDFTSRTGKPLDLYALADPALSNNGNDDSGSTAGGALLAQDASAGEALVASPGFTRTSVGYLGTSDGWTDLRPDFRMDAAYDSAPNGNVVQTGRTALDGV